MRILICQQVPWLCRRTLTTPTPHSSVQVHPEIVFGPAGMHHRGVDHVEAYPGGAENGRDEGHEHGDGVREYVCRKDPSGWRGRMKVKKIFVGVRPLEDVVKEAGESFDHLGPFP